MELIPASIGIQSELVVIITKVPTNARRIWFYYYTLYFAIELPKIHVDAFAIIASTQVGDLQTLTIPRIVPLVILKLE
jgi:hypothetical protein